MKKEELYKYVDHTALKASLSWDEVKKLCQEAMVFRMACVCVPSGYVKAVRENFPNIRICTVVGFPMGHANTASKVAETKQAIEDGADEIDMVIDIGFVKSEWFDLVEDEILQVRKASKDHILKVIIETCYLTQEEKIEMCRIVSESGADYIKTSTGFGSGGATIDDVRLMKEHLADNVKIKAAGGIRSREEMEAYIAEGCSRIGTSSALNILSD